MKKLSTLLFLFASVILSISCSKSVVYDEKVTFPNDNWAFENRGVTFEVPLKGSDKPFTVILELELIGTPNVDKFDATCTLITPRGGKTISALFFNFLNPREPYLQGDAPNKKIYKLTVYPKKFFSETGTYSFLILQSSNKADNYGIRSLRMYIKQVKE